MVLRLILVLFLSAIALGTDSDDYGRKALRGARSVRKELKKLHGLRGTRKPSKAEMRRLYIGVHRHIIKGDLLYDNYHKNYQTALSQWDDLRYDVGGEWGFSDENSRPRVSPVQGYWTWGRGKFDSTKPIQPDLAVRETETLDQLNKHIKYINGILVHFTEFSKPEVKTNLNNALRKLRRQIRRCEDFEDYEGLTDSGDQRLHDLLETAQELEEKVNEALRKPPRVAAKPKPSSGDKPKKKQDKKNSKEKTDTKTGKSGKDEGKDTASQKQGADDKMDPIWWIPIGIGIALVVFLISFGIYLCFREDEPHYPMAHHGRRPRNHRSRYESRRHGRR